MKTPATPATTTALAPGFRFHPTDEELVSYYLKRKVCNKPVRFNAIGECDIYKHEPCDLAVYSRLKTRDQEWYFFSALDKKYGNGARMNRATGKGYWKATGKDREIRRDKQPIGMKKTLVFHSGRAPDGQRTNWVMHEYRLVEDEFRAAQDSYVLCRIFLKNNIGPPSANRYAPFMEEEWDDGKAAMPGEDVRDDFVAVDYACDERNDVEPMHVEQVSQPNNKEPINVNELPKEAQNVLAVCKSERRDECLSLCVLNTQAALPLLQYKRRRQNDSGSNGSNGSDNSTGTEHDHPSSSTTTTAETALTNAATTTAISALLEFSLMEAIEPPKENPSALRTTFGADGFDSSVPPSCVKLIKELQKQVHKTAVERETLKLEMMSAQAMINILQSRIDYLSKENEDLKRGLRGRKNA
ncbi:NAC domain containing protein 50-like [Mangifera indica]|uniref:NAC domain containing protein 50-like n=1 Tax=Mangifera indica TaxID=29780 RepID=UPI001CFB0930|nr:NAC domain containing protein 50-like [Mangifera indica]